MDCRPESSRRSEHSPTCWLLQPKIIRHGRALGVRFLFGLFRYIISRQFILFLTDISIELGSVDIIDYDRAQLSYES